MVEVEGNSRSHAEILGSQLHELVSHKDLLGFSTLGRNNVPNPNEVDHDNQNDAKAFF